MSDRLLDLICGEVFQSRYLVEKLVGEGGVGQVYKARDLVLDRSICIKVLRTSMNDQENRARFLNEGQILAECSHENIVRCYQTGLMQDWTPFLIIEWIEGPSLRQYMKESQISNEEILHLVSSICDALSYAHSHQLLHRDLKPENILLTITDDGTRQIKVIDFGIAKWCEQDSAGDKFTKTGVLLGSPAYMSPEQCRSERNIDGRSDIYSLGCILYELLAGSPPFEADVALMVLQQHCSSMPPPLPPIRMGQKIDQSINAIARKCLSKEPSERYCSADELKADIVRTLQNLPLSEQPQQPPGSRRGQVKSAASVFLICTSAALMLLIAVVAISFSNRSLLESKLIWAAERGMLPLPKNDYMRWAEIAKSLQCNNAAATFLLGLLATKPDRNEHAQSAYNLISV